MAFNKNDENSYVNSLYIKFDNIFLEKKLIKSVYTYTEKKEQTYYNWWYNIHECVFIIKMTYGQWKKELTETYQTQKERDDRLKELYDDKTTRPKCDCVFVNEKENNLSK